LSMGTHQRCLISKVFKTGIQLRALSSRSLDRNFPFEQVYNFPVSAIYIIQFLAIWSNICIAILNGDVYS
jgi:hypothetical protein